MNTQPADILVENWGAGSKPTLFVSVTYPLKTNILIEAIVTASSA